MRSLARFLLVSLALSAASTVAASAATYRPAPAPAPPAAQSPAKRTPAKRKRRVGSIRTGTANATAAGHGEILTATATCPGRTLAISGGFSAPPVKAGGGALVVVFESQKLDQRSWRASAQIVDITKGDDPVAMTAYVYCRKRAPRATTVATTVATPPLPLQFGPSPVATCPSPLTAIAGGFSAGPQLPSPPPSSAFVNLAYELYRTGPASWQTSIVSGAGIPGSATTYAYCAKLKRAPQDRAVPGAVSTSSQNKSTVTANCARGAALSGGFSNSGAALKTGAFYPYESRRERKGWRVSGLSQGNGPLTEIAHAYCG
ncbi:MAG: hypothetical protein ACXWEF_03050 [Solirubrobacterales bacterium]